MNFPNISFLFNYIIKGCVIKIFYLEQFYTSCTNESIDSSINSLLIYVLL